MSASQWRFKNVGAVALVADEAQALRATILRNALFLDAKPDQCLVFRCSEPFSPKTQVTVKIAKIPSLEGSLVGAEYSFTFSTVQPLSVSGTKSTARVLCWA